MLITGLKPTLKNAGSRHAGHSSELCPNLPKCSIPSQKTDIDNNARFRYQVGYWFRLIDALICCDAAEPDKQFTILIDSH